MLVTITSVLHPLPPRYTNAPFLCHYTSISSTMITSTYTHPADPDTANTITTTPLSTPTYPYNHPSPVTPPTPDMTTSRATHTTLPRLPPPQGHCPYHYQCHYHYHRHYCHHYNYLYHSTSNCHLPLPPWHDPGQVH